MKKLNLFAIFVLSFFVFTVNVNAITKNDNASIAKAADQQSIPGLSIKNSVDDDFSSSFEMGYDANQYVTDINGSSYSAYCLDPNKTATGSRYIGDAALSSARSDDRTEAYDAAILAVADLGYQNGNVPSDFLPGDSNRDFYYYVSTLIAIRALSYSMSESMTANTVWSGSDVSASAYMNLALEWMRNTSATSVVNQMNSSGTEYFHLTGSYLGTNYKSATHFVAETGTVGEVILNKARDLYIAGVNSAYAYSTGNYEIVSLDLFQNTVNSNDVSKTTFTIRPKGIENETKLIDIDLSLGTSSGLSFSSIEVLVNGVRKGYSTSLSAVESTLASVNDVTLTNSSTIQVIVSYNVNKEICEPLRYDLNVVYGTKGATSDGTPGTPGTPGTDAYYTWSTNPTTSQRFLIFVPATPGTPGTPGSGNGDDNTGGYGGYNIENEQLNGYIEGCSGNNSCPTEMNIPSDCTNLGDSANNDTLSFYIDAPDDILSCIINNTDDIGNSYKANSCNYTGANLDNNAYCTVSCKEDYSDLRFPGIQDTNAGGYFKIGATVTGVKTCYTSNIDEEAFYDDMYEAQQDIIDAYNEIQRLEAESQMIVSKTGTEETTEYSCEGSIVAGPHVDCDVEIYPYDKYCDVYTYSSVEYNAYSSGSKGQFGSYNLGLLNTVYTSVPETNKYGGSQGNGNCYSTPTNNDPAGIAAAANAALPAAIAKLNEKIAVLDSIINSYDSCNDWTMKFDSSPSINYEYAEGIDHNSGQMQQISSTTTGLNTWYCNGDVNDEYNYCDGVNSNTTTTAQYLTCSANTDGTYSCGYVSKTIPTVDYIKQSINKTSVYDTPRIYYSDSLSGEIRYDDNDGQAAIVDGLPVKLDTDEGLHNFNFTIDNLGEYYSSCSAGRLIDADTSKTNSVEDFLGTMNFQGVYNCYYEICPDCDFVIDQCTDDPTTPENDCCEDDPNTPEDECAEPCPACIFLMGNINVHYRNVSTNGGYDTFNPNDRPLGYNWNYLYDITEVDYEKYAYIIGKANLTLNDPEDGIFALGDTVYAETPVLSITLTPNLASFIIDYNSSEAVANNGGYLNDSMTCYDYSNSNGIHENVFCYSDFFDDLLSDGRFNDLIEFDNRPAEGNRNTYTPGYWEVYSGFDTYVFTETTIGGPSWR